MASGTQGTCRKYLHIEEQTCTCPLASGGERPNAEKSGIYLMLLDTTLLVHLALLFGAVSIASALQTAHSIPHDALSSNETLFHSTQSRVPRFLWDNFHLYQISDL